MAIHRPLILLNGWPAQLPTGDTVPADALPPGGAVGPHTHLIEDVIGLQAALDGRALLVHSHAIADVTGLQGVLDGKAASSHGHAIADVTGLQGVLDGKAPSVHGHAIADVTGLQGALDGKAPLTGAGTSGTWPISITGSAGSASAVAWGSVTGKPGYDAKELGAGNWGQHDTHGFLSDFNAVSQWGATFVQGTANGPGTNGATQYYQTLHSLGSEYGPTTYAMQVAYPRNVSVPYISIRYREAGAWNSWQKISAGYADSAGYATYLQNGSGAYCSFEGSYLVTKTGNGIIVKDQAAVTKGFVYFGSTDFGLLNNQGGWSVRCLQGSGFGGELVGNWIIAGQPLLHAGYTGVYTSANRPGPIRLYRRDSDFNYSVQTWWTGSRWRLEGYSGDTFHAGCEVSYCDTAGVANALADGITVGTIYASNWFRSTGQTGWFNGTYSVGIYATAAGWVRTYNNARFWTYGLSSHHGPERNPSGTWAGIINMGTDASGYHGLCCSSRWGGNGSKVFEAATWWTGGAEAYTPILTVYGDRTVTVTGELRCTANIIAYYSDERLKRIEGLIPEALAKVRALAGFFFRGNEKAAELGYDTEKRQVGVSAQAVEAILPELIQPAPVSADYKTLDYAKLVPLLIEAIKELDARTAHVQR